ncbi:MAG: hypothetical protein RLZZ624_1187 [Cyanobacteriota bacterium]|jgi:uncharacterized protein
MPAVLPLSLLESLSEPLQASLEALRTWIAGQERVVVAYSGGVDSALVAAIAAEQLGDRAEAVTAVSPALAPHLRQEARDQARWLGLRHREIATAELEDPAYRSNPDDRCYACKRELHRKLAPIAAAAGGARVLDGVNVDDLGDHRPGIQAAREHGVLSPLADLQIDKAAVRQLSRALGLPWWDKPAQPCLASRFPYGEPISRPRLERVAAAEQWLRQQGFGALRVRSQGETARLEFGAGDLNRVLQRLSQEAAWENGLADRPEDGDPSFRQALVQRFLALGFTAVALDLEGLVSGKLNRNLRAAPDLDGAAIPGPAA